MSKSSSSKENFENYRKKKNIVSSSNEMKSPQNASKKTDYSCSF